MKKQEGFPGQLSYVIPEQILTIMSKIRFAAIYTYGYWLLSTGQALLQGKKKRY